MLFNSYEYIYLFLPITFILYFVLNHYRLTSAGKIWLVLVSLFFYGWWKPVYIPLVLSSILFNFCLNYGLYTIHDTDHQAGRRRRLLIFGIAANVGLLGYFKYTDFIIANINYVSGFQLHLQNIVLPLGISFFTFTQIACLVDTYKEPKRRYSATNYFLFVLYFPHLLAGPIIHHKDVMPQFDNLRNKVLNYKNISQGLCLFFIGLLKKVAIADTFAAYANKGFANVHDLTFIGAWITSLSYTLQLYFDFSGYTDMAIGSSLLFNIRLPNNFNAPYRALDIQDFWRRWHITLSNFLRDYIYIPLGGSRVAEPAILANLLFTFLIGGIWHGAGWTFVIWGLLHGCAVVVHRLWKKLNLQLPALPAWLLTFSFVNVAWVFFRAGSPGEAVTLLKAMAGITGATRPSDMETASSSADRIMHAFHQIYGMTDADRSAILLIAAFTALSSLFMNSNQIAERFRPTWSHGLMLFVVAMYAMLNMDKVSEFLYFNF